MRLKTWLIPLIAWIVIFMGLKLILGGGCNDGWGSSSIGRMGACSHHGGVNHTPGFIAFFISTAIAAYLFFKIDEMDTRKIKNAHSIQASYFEMESTSAPFNPCYSLRLSSKEINFTHSFSWDGDKTVINIPSSPEELKYILSLSEKIKKGIENFREENTTFGCDGESVSIKTFNGSQEMSFVTPMLFISFESISPATLEMMTYLRNRLGFDLH